MAEEWKMGSRRGRPNDGEWRRTGDWFPRRCLLCGVAIAFAPTPESAFGYTIAPLGEGLSSLYDSEIVCVHFLCYGMASKCESNHFYFVF
eukprot:scaffold38868_cov37-Attheya_sp.AAC.1